jgi:raffinose/stachyose/melibiose transport system substrate-binding protein
MTRIFQDSEVLRAIAVGLIAALLPLCSAWARQPITMWFWGATPDYRRALEGALITPFNKSQSQYELVVEYRASVDNDVRVALMGGGGPDLVYTSGPADVVSLARAGKLAPLDSYANTLAWNDRLQKPLLASCMFHGRLYCVPLSQEADGLFYNKAVLKKYGWSTPRTEAEVESIMRQAQAAGLYASVTGNRRWQPVNENYSSIFLNQYLGPADMACLIAGRSRWTSPPVQQAMVELRRWFQNGYLGNQDYFALDFDVSLLLLKQGRSPFFFAPTILFQWAPKYFKGREADDIGFAPIPRLSPNAPYPFFDIGTAFTYSINEKSKVKDGAAQVLQMMLSPRFITEIAKSWPGYWAPPLKQFPSDPQAGPIGQLYYKSMLQVSQAVARGDYGYRTGTFLPPNTKDIFVQDVEAVWLDQETPLQMLEKVQRTFDHEQSLGLVRPLAAPVGPCPEILTASTGRPAKP